VDGFWLVLKAALSTDYADYQIERTRKLKNRNYRLEIKTLAILVQNYIGGSIESGSLRLLNHSLRSSPPPDKNI